jgi:carbon-monoxide dehydrogenase medium subunit
MKPAPFHYIRAASIDDATQALADNPEARILAGGQRLIALMNLRMIKPECLIDINRVSALDYIKDDGDRIAVGALARHNDVKHSPLVGEGCPLLAEAYESISHHTVRNRGTLGGNLCHADPSSEAPAVMVAIGAEMVLQSSKGVRQVAAESFFLGLYETAARQDEMLTEIRLPKRGSDGWAFAEVSNRHGDFAMAAVATTVRMTKGTCEAARVVASGVGEHAARLVPAEEALVGSSLDEASLKAAGSAARRAVDPQSDYHADAEYRRELIDTLTRRTVQRAAERCG